MFADALVDDWLYARVGPAAGGGRPPELGDCYPDMVPQGGGPFPCVVYQQLRFALQRCLGPTRELTRATYLVKVVAPGEAYETLRAALDWVDSRLQSPPGQPWPAPVVEGEQLELVRYRTVGDDGVVWLHHGARWAFTVQPEAA